MPVKHKRPLSTREYRRQTERQLVIAVAVVLVVVGSLIIGLVYGWPAIFTAWLCLLPGAGIFVALWLLLNGLEYLIRERDE